MIKVLFATVLTICLVSVLSYAHIGDHGDQEFPYDVYHAHDTDFCAEERDPPWHDGYITGFIMSNHDEFDATIVNGQTKYWHYHRHVSKLKLNPLRRARSDEYYSQHRHFYCGTYNCGGPKHAQRVYPEDGGTPLVGCPEEVQEAPSLKKTFKLATTWAALKVERSR